MKRKMREIAITMEKDHAKLITLLHIFKMLHAGPKCHSLCGKAFRLSDTKTKNVTSGKLLFLLLG